MASLSKILEVVHYLGHRTISLEYSLKFGHVGCFMVGNFVVYCVMSVQALSDTNDGRGRGQSHFGYLK